VIPQVLGPVIRKGTRRGKPYQPPERCPVCKSKVEHPKDEVMVYCPNVSCPGRVFESIVHFAARGALDIRGLGPERVKALLDAKLIENVADLYDRKKVNLMRLLALEGFAEKSAQQLLDAIQASKRQPLAGQTFVITGTLPSLSRARAAELIEAAGGHVTDSVSKKTTAVVVGADAGSKLEKAKALGIPVIDEAELLRRARVKP